MSRKNIRLEWFGRGNIDDIETVVLSAAADLSGGTIFFLHTFFRQMFISKNGGGGVEDVWLVVVLSVH